MAVAGREQLVAVAELGTEAELDRSGEQTSATLGCANTLPQSVPQQGPDLETLCIALGHVCFQNKMCQFLSFKEVIFVLPVTEVNLKEK